MGQHAVDSSQRGLEHAGSLSRNNYWAGYSYTMKTLVSGGVAGCCAKTTTAPLDRLKILYQAKNQHYAKLQIWSGFLAIYSKESLLGYYKGNGAMMARIFPYAAIQFTAYERYKKILMKMPQLGPLNKFASGSLAGITAVTFTYPLDIVRARLAFQVNENKYRGIVHTLFSMMREEGGARAVYRGFVPTILGMIPYAGVAFYTYEALKFVCFNHFPEYLTMETGHGAVLSVPGSLGCGACSGLIAQITSYPLDVVRRRMQLSTSKTHTDGCVRTLVNVYRQDGVRYGLYRGVSLNFIRVVPQVAVSFTVYEKMKQFFGIAAPPS
ncbi:solute carrier family 25 member 16-like [Sycon ciliatum]|uniref:solute carrier family 25 member 16-like n=1 Tax=Sycon ciliatum TaxID=27933 RepID=UPI0020AC22DD|eukprot:scpid76240/ scgid18096/ Graves disease carrier protein; Graves disease autoantigen; Mitochondrial solute carrier protein homolog; Solute carrier family 25 member 16